MFLLYIFYSDDLADEKHSYQSEDIPLWDAGANNAVSRGNPSEQYFSWWDPGTCSRTAQTGSERPWWLVDLGQEYRIHKITIETAHIYSGSSLFLLFYPIQCGLNILNLQ